MESADGSLVARTTVNVLVKLPDGTVVEEDGRVVFFSLERFVNDICLGDCCFLCGRSPGSAPFSDEHVIPDWILTWMQLHAKVVTLPNGAEVRYDRYKVPCCSECNARMATTFEEPLSHLFKAGQEALERDMKENGAWRVFAWLALIFLKTHLKDREFRWHLDARKGTETISERYFWEHLHHIHCVARSFISGCQPKREVMGSLLVAQVRTFGWETEKFDYGDLFVAHSILLRLQDVVIIAVLNDSGICLRAIDHLISRIEGPLSPPQFRELMLRLAACNLSLASMPRFSTQIDARSGTCEIVRTEPPVLGEFDRSLFGALMESRCGPLVTALNPPNRDQILEGLRGGRLTFLFDDEGKFIHESTILTVRGAPAGSAEDTGDASQ